MDENIRKEISRWILIGVFLLVASFFMIGIINSACESQNQIGLYWHHEDFPLWDSKSKMCGQYLGEDSVYILMPDSLPLPKFQYESKRLGNHKHLFKDKIYDDRFIRKIYFQKEAR